MAGICGTDLQILAGYAGFSGIPGHEFVGIVEEVPSQEQSAWVGRRVVGEINIGCGACRFCQTGVREHCTNRTVLGIRHHDGAFAEYLWLPAANLHALPDDLDDAAAVFVEPVAAACRILQQVTVDAGAAVAVIGDGRLGLLIAQVLRTTASNVTVFGRHAEKLMIATALGLDVRTSAGEPHSYDLVVDATGRPEGLTQALNLVRPRGTVVMKSTFHGEAALATWPIVVDEVTLIGSRCGPFDRAIELLSSGRVATAPLVSATYRLDEHQAAFRAAATSLKVLFDLRD
jgi:alcohol dehydrogenase